MLLSLLYHDVVDPADPDASGFAGGAAGRYKLGWPAFERHLSAIAAATPDAPRRCDALPDGAGERAWMLTFDDGGASARQVGERLAELGWPAHFFVTTDFVGAPAFVTADDVRALVQLGHVVGSHSCSHPDHMALAGFDEVLDEWTRSRDVLSELLGEPARVASVPAGSFAPHVAQAADRAGYTTLFTSEPVARADRVGDCTVIGRYALRGSSSPELAARLAAGSALPRARQLASWRAKKAVKRVLGPQFDRIRRRLLD